MDDRVEEWLTVRTAVAADLPALQLVFRAAALSIAANAAMLLERPEFLIFTGDGIAAGRTIAAVTGRLVGFATVTVDGELDDLFVDPAWQRRGIARHLIRRAAGIARADGHRHLEVTGNPHALAFYLAVGFVLIGEVPTELGTGLRMSLDLAER